MRERNDSTLALPATSSQDVLTGLLRQGAQRMLAEAIDAEVAEWIEAHCELARCRRPPPGGPQWPFTQTDDPLGRRPD